MDVDFVRKAVRAVGQAAIKIESAAERCVSVLMELIETRVSYVVQEAVIVIKVCSTARKLMNSANHLPGYLPEVSSQLRGDHPYFMCEPGGTGRA